MRRNTKRRGRSLQVRVNRDESRRKSRRKSRQKSRRIKTNHGKSWQIMANHGKSWQIKTKKSKAVPSEARQKLENEEEIIGESRRYRSGRTKFNGVYVRRNDRSKQIKENHGGE